MMNVFLLAVSKLYKTPQSLFEGDCKPHSGYEPFGSSCYKAFSDFKKWPEAEVVCSLEKGDRDITGHLASVESAFENSFLDYLARKSKVSDPWIGFSASGNKQPMTFEWIDGTPVYYTNWQAGEPKSVSKGVLYANSRNGILTRNI